MEKFQRATVIPLSAAEKELYIEELKNHGKSREEALSWLGNLEKNQVLYKNDKYQVSVQSGTEYLIHLSIKRIDREPIHDWRDLQEIKNQLVGPENEAVELYPAESRRVDSANQYHLWVLKEPDIKFPFGFNERYIKTPAEMTGLSAKQREFE